MILIQLKDLEMNPPLKLTKAQAEKVYMAIDAQLRRTKVGIQRRPYTFKLETDDAQNPGAV